MCVDLRNLDPAQVPAVVQELTQDMANANANRPAGQQIQIKFIKP